MIVLQSGFKERNVAHSAWHDGGGQCGDAFEERKPDAIDCSLQDSSPNTTRICRERFQRDGCTERGRIKIELVVAEPIGNSEQ